MHIYLSKQVNSIFFYNYSVLVNHISGEKYFDGIYAYIIQLIINNTTDVHEIASNIGSTFNVKATNDEIINMIIEKIVKSSDYIKYFTTEADQAALSIPVYNKIGLRYPQILHVELTSACNLNCHHCYKNANVAKHRIDFDELISKIYVPLKNKVQIIHLTGGEPTIHPDFEKIVNTLKNSYLLQMTTNGTNIYNLPVNLFQTFQAIDISIYGLSNDEYYKNTNMYGAFDKLLQSCKSLVNNHVDFRQTVVLNNNNWKNMEDYIMLAIECGAKTFSFSLPVLSGKLLQNSDPIWIVSQGTTDLIYRKYRELEKKYRDKIEILPWKRNQYSSVWKEKSLDGELHCSAGSLSWWMSEKFEFRPCALLPQEYLQLSLDQWICYTESKENIDWLSAYNRLSEYTCQFKHKPEDICSIFELISKQI